MHARLRPFGIALLCLLLAGPGCGGEARMSAFSPAPPAGATPYVSDDASTDRVALAFADLHADLRPLGEGRWTPAYHQLPAGSDWTDLRDALEQQAKAAGWRPHPGLSSQGTGGYPRLAWTDGQHLVAAALVTPPAGSDGATVLMLLSPRD